VLENKFQNINLQNTINSIKRPKILEEIKNKMAGQKFIPIILPNTKGDSVTLSTQNKKYVLIEFWASWCAPCRAETPKILKLYQKYNDKGFDIYAISLDKDLENWKKAIKEDATFQWQHVVEMLPYTKSKILQAYKVEFVPTNFLIDTEGNIIATDLNGKTLGEKLEELFGKK
jgi:thiol-disulfide isomerase/thioredoxin